MSAAPEISVVIPSFNRLEILPEVLTGLEEQSGAPPFEVIVVDDGSSDGTVEWLRSRRSDSRFRFLYQENRGPAAARNRGVDEARGLWVAFLGDDTVPIPGWLACMRAALERCDDDPQRAIIGHTAWHERMRLNPFLRHINDNGLQFGFALIEDPEDVPFNFFYTSNLCLARQRLVEEPFDLDFPYPAWEDIEVSYRLKTSGLRISYEPAAQVRHFHPTDLARFFGRQEKAGYSAVVFYRRHPELGAFLGVSENGPAPRIESPRWYFWWLLVRLLQPLPVSVPRLWDEVLRGYYIRGLHRGWNEGAGIARGANDAKNS